MGECKGHEARVHFWRNLWRDLTNSEVPEEKTNPMWQVFKSVTDESIKETIRSNTRLFSEAVVRKIEVSGTNPYTDEDFDEAFWMRLVQLTRNRGCIPLDETLTVSVSSCEGQSELTLAMVEDRAVREQEDVSMVPAQMLLKDNLDSGISTQEIINEMKLLYDKDVSEIRNEIVDGTASWKNPC